MKKILVADDEIGITRLVSSYLLREKFTVFTANDGIQAYDIYMQEKPDLLILDIMMPELDGLELVELIRKDSNVPIIFLTAKTDELDRIHGFKYGVDDYVPKPFSPGELVERVKAILRRSYTDSTNSEQSFEYGPFICRLDERQIIMNGDNLSVTKAQFDIFYKLISSPGRVFHREQLHPDQVSGELEISGRTIDVQIKNIRKAIIDLNGNPDVIITHRGIGYSFKKDLNKE